MRSQSYVKKTVFLVATVNNRRDFRELELKLRQAKSDSKRVIFIKKNCTIWENYLVDIFFPIIGISKKISLVKPTSEQLLRMLIILDKAGERWREVE